MRLSYSLLALSLPPVADGFLVNQPRKRAVIRRTYPLFVMNDETKRRPEKDTLAVFDDYLLKVEAAFGRAQKRMDKMQQDMKTREQQSRFALSSAEERMKNQEKDFASKLIYLGSEIKNVKVEEDERRITVIDQHRAREAQLEREMASLARQVEAEKQKMLLNKETMAENLARKEELDAQLAELKKKLENETQSWSAKYDAEQEARRKDVAAAQKQVEEIQASARTASEEAERRILALQQELSMKEQEKEKAIILLKEEMHAQEQSLKDQVSQMNTEVENLKQEAQDEKLAVIEEYAARERVLHREVESLNHLLESEKASIVANQEETSRLVAERAELSAHLEELQRQYNDESKNWTEKYHAEQQARQIEVSKAQAQLQDQQEKANLEAQELQDRVEALQQHLTIKETEKLAAVSAIRDEMKVQQAELKEVVERMGVELTDFKLEAHREKMAVIEQFNARESEIQREVEELQNKLNDEKNKFLVNQQMTNRILSQRVELDAELGNLKQRFEKESQNWTYMYQREQEARRNEVSASQRQLEEQQSEAITQAKQLLDRVSALQEQLSAKEKQKHAAVLAIKEEMRAQSKELREKVSEMGLEVTNIKLQAHREKIAIEEEYKKREKGLVEEIQQMHKELEAEKEKIRINQEMTGRIVTQRVEIDAQLGHLKREFEAEGKEWSAQYQAERAAHQDEVQYLKHRLEQQQAEALREAKELQERVSSLKGQLSTKEKEKQGTILALKQEMKLQKKDFEAKAGEMGMELTNVKLQQHREKMAIADQYKVREALLQKEMDSLHSLIEAEKEKLLINQDLTRRILAQRVELDMELGQLKKKFDEESRTWSMKYQMQQANHKQSILDAKQKLAVEQEQALTDATELYAQIENLKEQLSRKERLKHAAILAIKDQMKAQAQQLKNKVSEMGFEVTNLKIKANQEKIAAADEYKTRELQIRKEMNVIQQLLDAEKDAMNVNQDLTNRILAQRVHIDAELGKLKRRYEQDSTQWNSKYKAEQEARRNETYKAQQEIEALQQAAARAATEAEERRVCLVEQLAEKERQMLKTVHAIKDETKAKEQKLMDKVNQLGLEVTNTKISAHQNTLAVIEEYKMRELQLQNEIDGLNQLLDAEKESMIVNQNLTHRILSQRINIDVEFGKLKRQYENDCTKWDAKYKVEQQNRRTEVARAQKEMEELQQAASEAAREAEQRRIRLKEQVAIKEKEKHAAVLAIKEEMKVQKQELFERANEIGNEVTNLKINANKEKISLVEEYKLRENQLKQEMDALVQLLNSEKKTMRVNQELANRILAQRIQIDAELGKLKRLYEQDCRKWDAKFASEQQARRSEVSKAQLAIEKLHQETERATMEAEKRHRNLLQQLEAKEEQKVAAVLAIKDQMKAQEDKFKEKTSDMGSKITKLKIDAHKEKMALIEEYKGRELQLQKEVDGLQKLLQAEKDSMQINQDLMNQVCLQRDELDSELCDLKRQYEEESRQWSSKYIAEQEARMLAVSQAQMEMAQLQHDTEQASIDAEIRRAALINHISMKEEEKQAAINEAKEQMKTLEVELREVLADMTIEFVNLQMDAKNDKRVITEEFKAREQELQNLISELQQNLGSQSVAIATKVNGSVLRNSFGHVHGYIGASVVSDPVQQSAEEELAQLKLELEKKDFLRSSVKLYLQQGRIDEAIKYLEE